MRRSLSLFVAVLGLAACGKPAPEPDLTARFTPEQQQLLQQGSLRARSCAACHGANGISRQALYPSLAGLPETQLTEALQQYRDGSRKHALMSPQARGLTDDDIALLAAYYALLPGPSQP